jgi:hypothetical protein
VLDKEEVSEAKESEILKTINSTTHSVRYTRGLSRAEGRGWCGKEDDGSGGGGERFGPADGRMR